MKGLSPKSRPGSLLCPLCETAQLRPFGRHAVRCEACGDSPSEAMLKTLRQITELPDAPESHACECGHPEMRRLPDGTLHCPACRSEVVPIDTRPTLSVPDEHGQAWCEGWVAGHSGKLSGFVDNPDLAKCEAPSDRLDYYRGHRAGSEARRAKSGPLLARARKVGP